MKSNLSCSVKKLKNFCRNFLVLILLIAFLAVIGCAQREFTRQQFSRLSVRERAALFENEILQAANKEGVDPHLLWTIAYLESRFRPWLTSPKDARGMMQFIPPTARRFNLENPYHAVSAIHAAARYVKNLSNLFDGRVDSILAAYNSGEGTVSAYLWGRFLKTENKIINPKSLKSIGGVPPYTETMSYVGRGLKIYRWLINSRTFPRGVVRANFPTVISAAVARYRISDPELGKIPAFNNLVKLSPLPSLPPDTNQNQLAAGHQLTETPSPSPARRLAVYYESRTGNRYLLINGKKEKLPEAGAVIINPQSRPETNNRARSTFFAPPQ